MIRCVRINRYDKGTLRGFVDFELTKVGLIIRDCCWHEKNGKEWIAFPARNYEDPGGTPKWTPLLEFTDPYLKDKFREAAIAAIHEFLPKERRRDYGKEVGDERARAGDDPALLPGKAPQNG